MLGEFWVNNSEVFAPHSLPELNQALLAQPRSVNRLTDLLLFICATFSKGLLPVTRRCHRILLSYPFGQVAGQSAAKEHCRVIYFEKNGQGLSLYSDVITFHALHARRHADLLLTFCAVSVRYISSFLASARLYISCRLMAHSEFLEQWGVVMTAKYFSPRSGCLISSSIVSGSRWAQPSTQPIRVYPVCNVSIFLPTGAPRACVRLLRPHRSDAGA